MRRRPQSVLAVASALALVVTLAPGATADPSDSPDDGHHHESHSGAPELPPSAPGELGMPLVGNSDKDGTTNSDLAFWGTRVFAGNYGGFRIVDVSDPASPVVLSDYVCRGPQSDMSVYQLRDRLILFQSVDTPQTKPTCDGTPAGSSADTPLRSDGRRAFGFEGIRVFDVTRPEAPEYLTAVPTACGSHTHTLVPDLRNQRVLLYVSSYPVGSGVTSPADAAAAGPLACTSPHQKISIVEVPAADPAAARLLREEPLSSDTRPYPGAVPGNPSAPPFIACHDITVLVPDAVALAACAGDAQLWDISDPADPSASDGEAHTHIGRPAAGGAASPEAAADEWEFVHSAIATWDGRVIAFTDETGGGGSSECDGSAEELGGQSENGFYYFYPMVRPGDPAPPLLSRYMIPRPQGSEICVSHNGNVVPTSDGYLLVAGNYQGGDTVVDFTDPRAPVEVAYADRSDGVGAADSWSAYWYNDHVYTSSGLGRRGATANRGLDIAEVVVAGERVRTRRWHHLNPQTMERGAASARSGRA